MNEDIPILFLDIDGVLNYAGFGEDIYYDRYAEKDLAIDVQCLKCLQTVIESVPEAKIVWTTDWRYYDEAVWNGRWQNPRLYLEALSWLDGKVIGRTPMKMSSMHYHDIKWWLDAHPETARYAILEDSYFPSDWFGIEQHLVDCSGSYGLTEKLAEKTIQMLQCDSIKDWRHNR